MPNKMIVTEPKVIKVIERLAKEYRAGAKEFTFRGGSKGKGGKVKYKRG